MSKEARQRAAGVSPAIAEKMKELAELIAAERFGAQGVPMKITFSEIEEIGHQAGRALAAEVDRNLVLSHGDHFDGPQRCPQCGGLCPGHAYRRVLQTRDGSVELAETICQCGDCRRSFLPSAGSVEARRAGV